MQIEDEIEVLVCSEEIVPFPVYATQGASGADVVAFIKEAITLLPGESTCIPTGLFLEIPEGYEIQVRPRSGLALNHSVTVLNTPGTIDTDYRGEIRVILINHSKSPFLIEPKMRIAQLVLSKKERAKWIRKQQQTLTDRGSNGFGHTGLF